MTIIKNDITFRAEVLGKTKGNQLTGVMFNVVTPALKLLPELKKKT